MKLMVLDGNSLAYRAFFALPTDMITAAGQVTNSVYGFTSMLLSLLKEHQPDGVIVVFDRQEPTFRHIAAPEYKAQRVAQPDILYQQLAIIRELLTDLGVTAIDAAGFEGDDLLATIAKRGELNGDDVLIVSGDRDTYQLVADPHIKVLYNKRGVSDYALYDEAGIFGRTGVTPKQYADYAALRGDPSDNLDGVPGVGEKTAAKLINKYDSLINVFDHAHEQTPKLKEALIANRERVIRNAELMVLRRDAPVEVDISACAPRPNLLAAKKFFEVLEFRSMNARFLEAIKYLHPALPSGESEAGMTATNQTQLLPKLTVLSTAKEAISALSQETLYIGAAWQGAEGRSPLLGVAVVIGTVIGAVTDAASSKVAWLPASLLLEPIVSQALVVAKAVRGHNLKPLLRTLLENGVDVTKIDFDTAIAAYLLDPSMSSYEISEVLARYTNLTMSAAARDLARPSSPPTDQLNFDMPPNSLAPSSQVAESQVAESTAAAALAVAAIAPVQLKALQEQGVDGLYRDVELPLVRVLARMEVVGVGVDVARLRDINSYLTTEVEKLSEQIQKVAGKRFNVNSPKQLGAILFDEKKLLPPKKTKGKVSGKVNRSTDAATLEKLRSQWPELIEPLLRYREFEKLRSTYGEGLLQVVGSDGRIHATFNQTVARTGRLSSDQPNLHNIPVRSEEGKVFREAFVPSPGHRLLVADYNQIELRCIAHLADDPGLTTAFLKGEDIHTATAASVFNVAPQDVSSHQRSQAKMISYGLAYGMEAYGLGQRLAIGVDEAAAILNAYFDAFPNVKRYMDETIAKARQRGYTETIFHRRRPIPELSSSDYRIRQVGERQAMNSGIQGLAADIFKIALVRVDERLALAGLHSRVILQVHDEIVVEAPLSEQQAVEILVLEAMITAAKLAVPLEVNSAWGDSWGNAKS